MNQKVLSSYSYLLILMLDILRQDVHESIHSVPNKEYSGKVLDISAFIVVRS